MERRLSSEELEWIDEIYAGKREDEDVLFFSHNKNVYCWVPLVKAHNPITMDTVVDKTKVVIHYGDNCRCYATIED